MTKYQAASALFEGHKMPKTISGETSKYVILHGGSGNQLFQWAYSHYLDSLGFKVTCLFINKEYSVAHASNCISAFIGDCSHTRIEHLEIPKTKILRVLKDPTHIKNPIKLLKTQVSNNSSQTFSYSNLNTDGKYLIGYYQNSEMIYYLKENVVYELEKNLNEKLKSNKIVQELKGCQVIHVRQGDTMSTKNRNRVGVLSENYYKNLPLSRESPVVVLTDDVEGAKKTIRLSNVNDFYGPEDLDVSATLGVMAGASKLFCANSTMAWWGGLLAINNGAEVYIPDPFFLTVSPDPSKAFLFPGFIALKSEFMS